MEYFSWLWQGILSNWLADLLVLLTGGAMFLARVKQWRFTSPVLYGLAASCLMALTLYAVSVHHQFVYDQSQLTTTSNIQERVRAWLDAFGLGVRNATGPESYFHYVVTMRNGTALDVFRFRGREDYVVLQARLSTSAEQREQFKHLTKVQTTRFNAEVAMEIARTKIGFANLQAPLDNAQLEKRVPIAGLTEATFIGAVDEMDSAMVLLTDAAIEELIRDNVIK